MMEETTESKTLQNQYQGLQLLTYAVDQRTNTQEMLNDFRRQLSGMVLKEKLDENGDPQVYEEQVYSPIMNEIGIRENVQFLASCAEKHSIMGNMDDEQYCNFMANNHRRYARVLLDERARWAFKGNLTWMVGLMLNKIELIASRTIDNLEREGMTQSVRHVERTEVPAQKKGIMPYFGGG